MRIFYNLDDVPELSGLEHKARVVVDRACRRRLWRKWQVWVALAACGLPAGGGVALARLVGCWLQLDPASPWLGMIGAGIGGGFGGGVLSVIIAKVLRSDYAELLKQQIPEDSR